MKISLSKILLLATLLLSAAQLHAQMIMHTVAGMYDSSKSLGNGGPALSAQCGTPTGVAIDAAGNLYFSDNYNNVIRKVTPSGIISTIAGVAGYAGYNGDSISATTAFLNSPLGVAVDQYDNVYVADNGNFVVRKIDTAGIITKVAGMGGISGFGWSGDGGPANAAHLYAVGVAVDQHGDLFIADGNTAVRKVYLPTGIITTVAGGNTTGYSGNGGPATSAALTNPSDVAVDPSGNLYIADNGNNAIRWVSTATVPIIYTIAGLGPTAGGYSGDGGPAASARLNQPWSIALDDSGNLYISDQFNQRVRKIVNPTAAGALIATVAGDGVSGYAGDGGLATLAKVSYPNQICLDAFGSIYIADGNNDVVREVSKQPTISIAAHPGRSICYGTQVTFSASVVNPILGESYQWTYNGAVAGGDSAHYANSTTLTGDQVSCNLDFPSSGNMLTHSDTVTMMVNPLLYPSINITRDTNNICASLPVNFTATSVNGGSAPLYQWQVNGNITHSGNTLTYDPANNDNVTCFLTSNATCATPDTLTSNELTMAINADVIMDISIMANWSDSVGIGQIATFVAQPTNEGSNPGFQWCVNGVPVPGATANVYNTSSLSEAFDTVTCILTGSLPCTLPLTDTSAPLVVTVTGLSVAQTGSTANLSLLPNPNNGAFYLRGFIDGVNGDNISVEITDMLGQVVYTGKISVQNGAINAHIVPDNKLTPGMYMLHTRSGSQSGVISFIIQN